jgi:hypothetical protein
MLDGGIRQIWALILLLFRLLDLGFEAVRFPASDKYDRL